LIVVGCAARFVERFTVEAHFTQLNSEYRYELHNRNRLPIYSLKPETRNRNTVADSDRRITPQGWTKAGPFGSGCFTSVSIDIF
jgi:hypothetical protein